MPRYWRPVALIALVLFIYAQTLDHAFLNYDDDGYVTGNQHVLNGLATGSVTWAFSSLSRFYWHPLTWLSLMTDVELFGPVPGPMHAVNVALHGGVVLLVFFALRKLTGAESRSFAVAALLAVHPLRVESVAWIAERKDVLSALFVAATLLVYERYVRRPSWQRYAVVLLLLIAACMAKPMAVTLPILLILLDQWPLQRRALLEKVPMLAVSAATACLTYLGAQQMGTLDMLHHVSALTRLQNAIWSIGHYVRQTFVPSGFSIVYPYPTAFPGVAIVAIALAVFTGLAVWQRKQRPWILTGWLWFVIGVAPALGLLQAGVQARADRFTYIPHIGLFILIVWTTAEFLPRRFHVPATALVVGVLAVVSHTQAAAWRDSETIFAQALRNTSSNWLAEHKYGMALAQKNDMAGAETHLQRAASLDPLDPHSRFHLGRIAAAGRRHAEALALFTETVRLKPDYADAHFSRGSMLAALDRRDEAVEAFNQARAAGLAPEWAYQAHIGAGVMLARNGRLSEAEKQFQSAVALQPGSAEARRNLALAQEQLRNTPSPIATPRR